MIYYLDQMVIFEDMQHTYIFRACKRIVSSLFNLEVEVS